MALERQALIWDEREGMARSVKPCPIVAQGAAAYAAERAHRERALRADFESKWSRACLQGSQSTSRSAARTTTTASPLPAAAAQPAMTASLTEPDAVDEGAEAVIEDDLLFADVAQGHSDEEDLGLDSSDDEE